MQLWSDFLYLLTHDQYFRAGFIWGLGVVFVGWLIGRFFYWLHVHWLKMRQFFEPVKTPGKVPVATGPSPASMMLGCLGRAFVLVVVVATVIVVLAWMFNPRA